MSQKLNSDKVTLEAMSKEKAKNDQETKDMKKQIKSLKKELDKSKIRREMAQDEIQEAQRIELENKRQQNRLREDEQNLSEINPKNDIIKLKTEADMVEGQLHAKRLENQELQEKYEAASYLLEKN